MYTERPIVRSVSPLQHVQEVLNNANWNVEEAEESLKNNRKRTLKHSARKSNKKRRKCNTDEDVDVDSDEAHYKHKVFDR